LGFSVSVCHWIENSYTRQQKRDRERNGVMENENIDVQYESETKRQCDYDGTSLI
jgi:hypothetical protein